MKIMIVDDESFIRMNFKTFLDWKHHGYGLVGEASNGREALEKIDELDPDVVFLDIRMPLMDGLEVLRQLQQREHSCKVIILSSHNEFEYAREALRLGACDYIHKPNLTRTAVFEALARVQKLLNHPSGQERLVPLQQNMEKNRNELKNLFLRDLAIGVVRHEWEIEQKKKLYDLKLKQPNVCCIVMFIDQYDQVKERYKKGMEHLLGFSILNILQEVLNRYNELELFQMGPKEIVFLKSNSDIRSMNDILEERWGLIRKIEKTLKQFLNIHVSFSISGLHGHLLEIPKAYHEAQEAAEMLFFEDRGNVVAFEPGGIKTGNAKALFGWAEQSIKKAMAEKNMVEAISVVHEMFAEIKEQRCAGRRETLEMCVNMHYLIQSFLKETSGVEDPTGMQEIMAAERLEQLHLLLIRELETIQDSHTEEATSTNYKIKRVIDYIHQHYDHDLTLDELAGYVGLNNSYLSRIFKEQTGSMLIPYINRYRVKKSLDFLKDGKLKTYEIAEKVGFNSIDNYYISFKKLYGLPPNEYRKTYMGK
ncbi:two-component system response regulator YesN [Fontibacillus phaseoli]|uniref:Two-component system response regulator YesN n=1 Tax=Fontibacillus phaseoli TaxID=1416533 RepID=A0A369BGL4_9BACL|nr:response regulator [Fontibacillus phaseoli]RCX19617.1 two-component system response regulator YesN [Fontibacillus phaseoli]